MNLERNRTKGTVMIVKKVAIGLHQQMGLPDNKIQSKDISILEASQK